ncbi:MAG: glycoside hydrolase family 127 protein [Clostridia bacterium]|nr:glycoside hydrolase family 127 protein [Clostridia bacterium]
MKIQQQLPIHSYKPGNGFIGSYQKLIRNVVIPYQYEVLCDKAEDTEKSHVIDNFRNAAKALRHENTGDGFYGMVFQDSDAAKWLEAVAYSLSVFPDEKLEKTADELIDIIADAQDKDGYLNTYYTIKDKDKRWTNILEGHELYCSGHMMEAATAYFEATGKDKLLKVMEKNAEHIYNIFIEKGHEGYPGHPEIELALMKMYRLTKNERLLSLARHFIDIRGVDPHYYEKERKERSWTVWNGDGRNHHYQQSHAPVREQKDAVGHSVRAVYLYTAMADAANTTDDKQLLEACRNLWNSITQKRMYITGAIGSTVHGEAFTEDYDLPSDTAYAETCASIGLMMFASQMLQGEVNGEYADIMEKAFYNTVLAGMAKDGKRFFYVNPLEVIPGISGKAVTHRHDLTQRPKWYTCACCPPNVARLISSFGKYAYGEGKDTAYCHLYAEGEVIFSNGVKLKCETGYPYNFIIRYIIEKGGKIAIRIPGWSKNHTLTVNGIKTEAEISSGYIYLTANDGDEILLNLSDEVKIIYPSSRIPTLSGLVSIMRGPIVYCFEGTDNDGDVLSLRLRKNGAIKVKSLDCEQLGSTVQLELEGLREHTCDSLYSSQEPAFIPCTAKAIPYYLWGNRGENQMRVWIPYK